jgi:hypothetical protein
MMDVMNFNDAQSSNIALEGLEPRARGRSPEMHLGNYGYSCLNWATPADIQFDMHRKRKWVIT